MDIISLFTNDKMTGRFGMNMEQSVEYLLSKAKEVGLTVYKVYKAKDGKQITVDFYPPRKERPAGWVFPWDALRKLSMEMGGHNDCSGDPPWDYTFAVEVAPPQGKYITV